MTVETQDRVSELAKETLAKFAADEKSAAEQKTKEESKGASSEKPSTETPKTEGTEEKKDKESQEIKNDEELLKAEDKDLTEQEVVKKQELIKAQEAAKTPEQKLQEWQDKTQKRMDVLSGELKAEKEGRRQDAETIRILESNIAALKGDLEKSGSVPTESAKQKQTDAERYATMAEEDKALPKNERREMSKEDLEEFILEDMVGATEWISERDYRRRQEREVRKSSHTAATTIAEKSKKFFTEFPKCNQEARQKELEATGMTADKAIETVMAENPDFKLMMELLRDNPSFRDPNSGPELLAAEMKKRNSAGTTGKPNKDGYTQEELDQAKADAIKAEQERLSRIDTGLSNSTVNAPDVPGTPLYKEGLRLFIMAGKRKGQTWTEADYKDTLQHGKKASV